MALWRKNMAISLAEKQRREDLKKQEMVQEKSFYHGEVGYRISERIETANNRRAAKVYLDSGCTNYARNNGKTKILRKKH